MYKTVLLILIILITAGEVQAGITKEPEVYKHEFKDTGASSYILASDSCTIMFTLTKHDNKGYSIKETVANPAVLKQNLSCQYERRMQLTEKVLARIAKDTDNLKQVKSYHIHPDDVGTEPMYRLASVAAQSPMWDRKRGRPRGEGKKYGNEGLIEKYLRENNVFKELSDIFRKYHLKLKVRDVEMARVAQVKKSLIADYAKRPDSKISPDDKLPMRGVIAFIVEPL